MVFNIIKKIKKLVVIYLIPIVSSLTLLIFIKYRLDYQLVEFITKCSQDIFYNSKVYLNSINLNHGWLNLHFFDIARHQNADYVCQLFYNCNYDFYSRNIMQPTFNNQALDLGLFQKKPINFINECFTDYFINNYKYKSVTLPTGYLGDENFTLSLESFVKRQNPEIIDKISNNITLNNRLMLVGILFTSSLFTYYFLN
jgi:hypothetical protein